ncbi:MAG: hypothetical protein KGL53_09955, partial [Elusimicrobia bacterium]|nr:hypothetical protein [Elusimicrobiota bacterium]
PAPEAVAAPAPAPAPPPAPPVRYDSKRAPGAVAMPESLSTRLPNGMTEGEPSVYRLLMPAGWKADGTVRSFDGRDALAAAGDEVVIRVDPSLRVRRNSRFTVYRLSGPTEADVDQKAVYAQKMGVLEAVKRVGEHDYRARVMTAGGSIQTGDLVKAGD